MFYTILVRISGPREDSKTPKNTHTQPSAPQTVHPSQLRESSALFAAEGGSFLARLHRGKTIAPPCRHHTRQQSTRCGGSNRADPLVISGLSKALFNCRPLMNTTGACLSLLTLLMTTLLKKKWTYYDCDV
jgi:hypothetical protein